MQLGIKNGDVLGGIQDRKEMLRADGCSERAEVKSYMYGHTWPHLI
jgi:hypothetical protein